jgi:hypothetical protein
MSTTTPVNNCTANLTAGFIDLATYDELEKYMYGGPDATAYFVRETRKSTWFTQCPVMLAKCNGTPEFGAEWSCSISRAGDYLLGTWLHVVTPHVSISSTNCSVCIAWTPNFMHALVKECCITFNDLVAARFDTQHLDFWAAFTTPASKAAGYGKMIGASLPSLGTELPSQHLNLPLPFFYARDSGVALPTAALPYNEMRINFVFRDWREMIVAVYNSQAGVDNTNAFCIPYDTSSYPPNDKPQNNICNKLLNCCDIGNAVSSVGQDSFCNQLAGLAGKVSLSDVTFLKEPSLANGSSVQVWANYAIVSNEERKRMACAPRDILIEQVQTMPSVNIHQRYCFDVSRSPSGTNVSSSNHTNSKLINADVRFSHAIKVLFFAAKNITNNAVHSNYTTGIPVLSSSNEKLCVANCGLATRYNATTPSSITYQSATQYACELSDSQQSSKNTQYGIMTQQCCLKLDCCNAKDPLARASLVYENTNRLGLMTVDYYSEVQPYYHAPAIPHDSPNISSGWCQEGLHMYSYSLDFMCLDPMGSTNYGKLTNVQINVETQSNLGACGLETATLKKLDDSSPPENNGLLNISHAGMVETLYMTGNCTESNIGTNSANTFGSADLSGLYCTVPYQLTLTAVNNNIIRISGGALGFPVL